MQLKFCLNFQYLFQHYTFSRVSRESDVIHFVKPLHTYKNTLHYLYHLIINNQMSTCEVLKKHPNATLTFLFLNVFSASSKAASIIPWTE